MSAVFRRLFPVFLRDGVIGALGGLIDVEGVKFQYPMLIDALALLIFETIIAKID